MSRVYVAHGGYGCDTGCCGHWVTLKDDNGEQNSFVFDHASGDPKDWVKRVLIAEYGEEHVADIDWSECMIYDDDDNLVLGEW